MFDTFYPTRVSTRRVMKKKRPSVDRHAAVIVNVFRGTRAPAVSLPGVPSVSTRVSTPLVDTMAAACVADQWPTMYHQRRYRFTRHACFNPFAIPNTCLYTQLQSALMPIDIYAMTTQAITYTGHNYVNGSIGMTITI